MDEGDSLSGNIIKESSLWSGWTGGVAESSMCGLLVIPIFKFELFICQPSPRLLCP